MRNKEQPLRIATIGIGDIAEKAYLPVMANLANVIPVLVSRSDEKLAHFGDKYRINERYHTTEQLIASNPDAAMVHTASDTHFQICRELINAGIPTFVDKPISFLIEETRELIALAKQNNTALFLGVNRRFSPLIAGIDKDDINHVRWQKNRVNLVEDAQQVIFNDFIHLIDGLRFLAQEQQPISADKLKVTPIFHHDLLASIHVSYQKANQLFEVSMNRMSGITEEKLEIFAENQKIEINNLTSGFHWQEGKQTELGFSDWQSYLYTRGFDDMLAQWLNVVYQSKEDEHANHQQLDDILLTHELCHTIWQETL